MPDVIASHLSCHLGGGVGGAESSPWTPACTAVQPLTEEKCLVLPCCPAMFSVLFLRKLVAGVACGVL